MSPTVARPPAFGGKRGVVPSFVLYACGADCRLSVVAERAAAHDQSSNQCACWFEVRDRQGREAYSGRTAMARKRRRSPFEAPGSRCQDGTIPRVILTPLALHLPLRGRSAGAAHAGGLLVRRRLRGSPPARHAPRPQGLLALARFLVATRINPLRLLQGRNPFPTLITVDRPACFVRPETVVTTPLPSAATRSRVGNA